MAIGEEWRRILDLYSDFENNVVAPYCLPHRAAGAWNS